MVVLQEMPHVELALALGAQEEAEAEAVEETPRQGVSEVQPQRRLGRKRGQEGEEEGVDADEETHEVGSSAKKMRR